MFIYENRASVILFNILKNFKKTNKKFLIPLNSCSVVAFTFFKSKIDFELVDIANSTLCMDEELTLDILRNDKNNEYLGVLFINSYGINKNSNGFFKKIKEINPNLFIIDDRCLCIPDLNFSLDSTYADLTLFSTGASKYVEIGGAFAYLKNTFSYNKHELLFNLKDYTNLFRDINAFISNKKSFFRYIDSNWLGYNKLPFDNVEDYKQAISEQLNKVLEHKRVINNIYANELPKDIQYDSRYQVWRFNLSIDNKTEVLQNIFDGNLFAGSHYIPLNRVFSHIVVHYTVESNADLLYKKNINLFNNFDFTEDMALRLTKIIKKSI